MNGNIKAQPNHKVQSCDSRSLFYSLDIVCLGNISSHKSNNDLDCVVAAVCDDDDDDDDGGVW